MEAVTEHEALWHEARGGSEQARRSLIEAYLPMARRAARRMHVGLSAVADRDDIESVATLGLIHAVDRYDYERQVPFEAFALWRIRGAVLDELRRSRASGRSASTAKAAVSLDALCARGGEPKDDLPEPSEPVLEEDLLSDVRGALHALPSRERSLLDQYYFGGRTMREIGTRLGVTEARVCQLHARAIAQLRVLLAPSRT